MIQLIKDSYISYINLDHRKDRLSHIQDQFKQIGIDAERTKGMYPTEFDSTNSNHQVMRNRTVGAIGCYESQLNVMKKALSLRKHAMIFEDDVVFCQDFLKRIEYIDNWANNNNCFCDGFCRADYPLEINCKKEKQWQVIWLGGTFHVGTPYWHGHDIGRDVECTPEPRILRSYGSFSTHAYIVHRNALKRVIGDLEDIMHRSMGIDWSFIQLAPNMHNYVFVPGCVKQMDNVSDQIPGSGHITEFSRFSKLNGTEENSAYWYQDRMENFDPEKFDWKEARL